MHCQESPLANLQKSLPIKVARMCKLGIVHRARLSRQSLNLLTAIAAMPSARSFPISIWPSKALTNAFHLTFTVNNRDSVLGSSLMNQYRLKEGGQSCTSEIRKQFSSDPAGGEFYERGCMILNRQDSKATRQAEPMMNACAQNAVSAAPYLSNGPDTTNVYSWLEAVLRFWG